jgi:hypothetical protein
MPATLSCTISKIVTVPNKVNSGIIAEYLEYMRENGASERHQITLSKLSLVIQSFLERKQLFTTLTQKNR